MNSSCGGWKWSLGDVHSLISGTCDYVMFYVKGELNLQVGLKLLIN